MIWSFDVLPRLKFLGFWIYAGIAANGGLTSPIPREDAPLSIKKVIADNAG